MFLDSLILLFFVREWYFIESRLLPVLREGMDVLGLLNTLLLRERVVGDWRFGIMVCEWDELLVVFSSNTMSGGLVVFVAVEG